MERKERYKLISEADGRILVLDNELCRVRYDTTPVAILNEQDLHIKELEKALEAKESINCLYKNTLSLKDDAYQDLLVKNAKLQRAQKDFTIEELKRVKCIINGATDFFPGYNCSNVPEWYEKVLTYIDKRIDELKSILYNIGDNLDEKDN